MPDTSKMCPENRKHKKFSATGHVTQTWLIDEHGNFIEEVTSCDDTTHTPGMDDVWTCQVCGTEAVPWKPE